MIDKLEMPLEQFAEAVAKENARLTECLKAANEKHEHFEREWYLAKDRIEQLEEALQNYSCDCNLDDQDNCEVGCWDSASCGYRARTALGNK